jgi:hypothetical protein
MGVKKTLDCTLVDKEISDAKRAAYVGDKL